jgi:hypothetical protein
MGVLLPLTDATLRLTMLARVSCFIPLPRWGRFHDRRPHHRATYGVHMVEKVTIRYLNANVEIEIPLIPQAFWQFYEENWWDMVESAILASKIFLREDDGD